MSKIPEQEQCNVWSLHKPVDTVDKSATFIHIVGFPYFSKLEKLSGHCPKLKIIRINPCYGYLLKFEKYSEFKKREGIEIIIGKMRQIGDFYAFKKFLLNPPFSAQQKWEELKRLKFPGLDIMERYFCLQEEQRITLADLARQKEISYKKVRIGVWGIFKYLNPDYSTTSKAILKKVRGIENIRVPKLKRERRENLEKAECEKYGPIPDSLNRRNWSSFAKVRKSWLEAKKWEELKKEHPNSFQALMMRYDLDGQRKKALTLKEVGKRLRLSRQRIYQLEKEGINFLLEHKIVAGNTSGFFIWYLNRRQKLKFLNY